MHFPLCSTSTGGQKCFPTTIPIPIHALNQATVDVIARKSWCLTTRGEPLPARTPVSGQYLVHFVKKSQTANTTRAYHGSASVFAELPSMPLTLFTVIFRGQRFPASVGLKGHRCALIGDLAKDVHCEQVYPDVLDEHLVVAHGAAPGRLQSGFIPAEVSKRVEALHVAAEDSTAGDVDLPLCQRADKGNLHATKDGRGQKPHQLTYTRYRLYSES